MLAGMASSSLTTLKDERHSTQQSVVEMIGEALAGMEVSLQKAVTEAKTQVDGAGDMKTQREAALAEKLAALATLKEATAGSKQVLEEDEKAVQAAKMALGEAV